MLEPTVAIKGDGAILFFLNFVAEFFFKVRVNCAILQKKKEKKMNKRS